MKAPDRILELVEMFDRNKNAYMSGHYNEADIRIEFINPFFIALGWDVNNEKGHAPQYRDVVHEAAVKVGGLTKAPDYSFRIGGTRKFFLEAKKPSVDIKDDIAPAFQLRRYAWSAKMPLSILTDFEEFAVYDCRVKPVKNDKASKARVNYVTYKEYEERWEEIAEIFSKEAVLQGKFDNFLDTAKSPKDEVDAEFLKEIELWREELAKNIAKRNMDKDLTTHDLNFAVQKTIDRIIFLRVCEDRGIESQTQLMSLLNGEHTYKRLVQIFNQADDRYNSGLFHFKKERDRIGEPDELTTLLDIDDKVLKRIVKNLYYPDSPYEFSVLPADILGQVYEQFLGKVIRLTPSHQAKVDEKPEVRRAGGVYYTPTYIVEYIVEKTVGAILDGKTPRQVSKIRVLDPACGSGSFLIVAYQKLLDWHREWYENDGAEKHKKELYKGAGDEWRLTTSEKKRILLNNIYGVDIDQQAVEVTKLSLLLKVLEGESEETINTQLRMFHERALPDLGNNIKCGNSLIGPDFYENRQLSLLDDDERMRINVFDWEDEFDEIISTGGFDVVVGNPPYVGFHGFKNEKNYLKNKYASAIGKFDYYLPFIEKGILLLKSKGLFGYICPTNYMKRDHGKGIRKLIANSVKIIEICDFKHRQVFTGATNYTGIFIFQNLAPKLRHSLLYKQETLSNNGFNISQSTLKEEPWIFRSDSANRIIEKILKQKIVQLGKITRGISEGIVTGKNSVFLITRKEIESLELEEELIRPCLRGRQIQRYNILDGDEYILYPYKLEDNSTKALEEKDLKKYENLWSYLKNNRKKLGGRNYFESSSKYWYELWCQRDLKQLDTEKIVVPEISEKNRFAFSDSNTFYGDTVCGVTILPESKYDLYYILGLLNSNLVEFYYKNATVPKAGGYYIYKTMFLKRIPIRLIDFDNPNEQQQYDEIVSLVDQILSINNKLKNVNTPHEKTTLHRQIVSIDGQIDRLVYDLYDLTEDEIAMIEEEIRDK